MKVYKKMDNKAGILPKEIISLVDKILQLKGRDVNSDTREFEEEIDRVVYQLYNLNDKEIKIVEGEN